MEFSVHSFEGPLDLLLALVRKEEMDIMEIDIHQITQQYLAAIHNIASINLDEGGEFIQMASTLLYIKSKYLLPSTEEDCTEIEQEEILSKEDLIRALTEHNQFIKIAEQLNQRSLLNRDVWGGQNFSFIETANQENEIHTDGLFSLLKACKNALKKGHLYSITTKLPSILQWIHRIQSFFIKGCDFYFHQLTKDKHEPFVHQVLLSFLSLLELSKLGVVSMTQQKNDIHIHTKKTVDENILTLLGKINPSTASANSQRSLL